MINHLWKVDEAFYTSLSSFWMDEVSTPLSSATCGATGDLLTFTYQKCKMPQPCSQQSKADSPILDLFLNTTDR